MRYASFFLLAGFLAVASQLVAACPSNHTDVCPLLSAKTANMATFKYLHQRSEQIYDNNGSWGRSAYGYRMAPRASYWRADVYGFLSATNAAYTLRANQSIDYLLQIQAEGGTGAFGFPADVNNPEFGNKVRTIIKKCPACIQNSWVVSLPGNKISELYYDHGYALTAVARAYQRTGNRALLMPIKRAADWILDKPLTPNINYLSALSKGLSYAYLVTNDSRYLNKAIQLHRDGILPFINRNGEAIDDHNAQLEYHGFIVSGMIALRKSLPPNHVFIAELDPVLTLAVARMTARNLKENGDYGVTWPGTNLLAWHELSSLRALMGEEILAQNRVLALIHHYIDDVKSEKNGFRLQKALYTYFFIGLFTT